MYLHVNAKEGSGVDLYTRYLIQGLTEVCPGVNFVIYNYQNSSTGMFAAINANPDGLNLGTCSGSAIVQWHTSASDISLKDDAKIVGIMNLGSPQAIIAGFDAPYKNFNELAEYIKANPGQVYIGCSMGGTTQLIFTSFVEAIAGDKDLAMYVQCASEPDRLTNVASGALDIASCSILNALAYENDGRLNVLGTIGPNLSTLPTMSELLGIELSERYASGPEQGFNDATWESNYYVFAPVDTPDAVCRAINEAICKANETASYMEGNKAMATFVAPVYYNNTQAHFQREWTTIQRLVNELGLSAR